MAFVKPFLWLARRGKDDVVDKAFSGVGWAARQLNLLLARTQSGRLRYYLAGVAVGMIVFVALGLLL